MPLIEKAFAKSFGSYLALEKGTSRSALIDLTKCPVFTFDFQSKDTLELVYGADYEKQLEVLGLDEVKLSLEGGAKRTSRGNFLPPEDSNKVENSFGESDKTRSTVT